MQRAQGLAVEHGMAVMETDLGQAGAFAHQDREGARADLGIERTVIAGIDAIEAAGLVGDDAGEDVEPAGRTLRVGRRRDGVRQRQALKQRHDVDAAGFQHRAVGQRDLVQLQFVDTLGDGGARSGQEACAHAVGDLAETQVEARRLDLILDKVIGRQNRAAGGQCRDHPVRQYAPVVDGEFQRHDVALPRLPCWPPGASNRLLRSLADGPLDGKPEAAYEPIYPVVI